MALSFRGARSAILAFYGARIEATRRSLLPRESAAVMRALVDERRAALRALALQKQAAQRAMRERRTAERFSARLAGRQETQERRVQTAGREEARPS